jgi:hypothetical protein
MIILLDSAGNRAVRCLGSIREFVDSAFCRTAFELKNNERKLKV